MTQDFAGKVAIVTGGASGIGEAVSRDLSGRGAQVVVADFNEEGVRALVDELSQRSGVEARAFKVDVSKPDEVEAMVGFTIKEFGQLDLAVNNAGIGGKSAPMGEIDPDDWHKVLNVNLHGVFYGMRYQIPAMLKSGGGSIVNMASILGAVGWRGSAAYVASKHAVTGITQTAALEYSSKGIRVNAVGPGFIKTPLIETSMSDEAHAGLVGMHPIGRLGTPDEVAAITNFLLSDAASFVTGSYYPVDGAFLAQ
ncbi:glucose 1-dehydrogenase [Altererythrobacter indicus]|uniref:Glucose 1-dehydrogenase n=1 Tax=Altericroceibacterium indicum TaxID=374177 RepID=A0A845AI19_9SPHN|nr:SDR family NAD(P)-dependent oxidoreductase [Altericroceibacterium indicum]MXP26758.1 glucose 1-dehydrogenase [Altericroceibacterium indicum]